MKKLLTTVLALFVCISAFAISPWLGEKGTVYEYETQDGKGKILFYTTRTVTDILDMGFQTRIDVEMQYFDTDKNPIEGGMQTMTYILRGNELTLDLNTVVPPMPEGMDITVTVRGDDIAFPLGIAVGDKLPPISFSILLDFQDPQSGIWYNDFEYTATTTTKREVIAKESVETEAGAFECYKIEQNSVVSVMGEEDNASELEWYADGIGLVKSETYNNRGSLETSETLISITK